MQAVTKESNYYKLWHNLTEESRETKCEPKYFRNEYIRLKAKGSVHKHCTLGGIFFFKIWVNTSETTIHKHGIEKKVDGEC